MAIFISAIALLRMKEQLITLDEFLTLRKSIPMLDARSEGEFADAHIPGAINLPILNNAERKEVGTLYKQKGSQSAVIKGFELVGPRFHLIIREAERLFPGKKILTYCWRGGMRSEIISWLLGMAGFEIFRLKGGYKAYRSLTFETVRSPRKFLVLGGKTGVGKTVLLKALQAKGESILDLEALAQHKGSSFGGIGMPPQPGIEQFENLLAEALWAIPPESPIWVENESRKIGTVVLADEFYQHMLSSPLLEIQKNEEERISHIAEEYAELPKEQLIAAVQRLQKRLGGLRTSEAVQAIERGDHKAWIANVLLYYDKTYQFDLEKNHGPGNKILDLSGKTLSQSIEKLLAWKKTIIWNPVQSN